MALVPETLTEVSGIVDTGDFCKVSGTEGSLRGSGTTASGDVARPL